MSQSQDKQLQEGRVYEQVLILALELGEPGEPVGPASRGLHGDGEQPVEELDVFCVRGGGGRVGGAELYRQRETERLNQPVLSESLCLKVEN